MTLPYPGELLLEADSELSELRRLTARGVVHRFSFGRGIAHFQFLKDETAKVLRVETWWWPEATEETRADVTKSVCGALSRWVWEGWTVELFTSSRPKPDVIWDPYRSRFVPRKAGVRPSPSAEEPAPRETSQTHRRSSRRG